MQRAHKMKTSEGMAGWLAYSTWLKSMGKKVPPQSGFISSRFYQSFIKFAAFTQSVKLPNVESFIRSMVKNDIPPVIWTNSAVYEEWIRSSTTERSPTKLVQASAVYLMKQATQQNIDISEIFENTTSGEVAQWIRNGDVSPWLLLTSTKFKAWFAVIDDYDKEQLSAVLNIEEWIEKIKANPNTISKAKAIVAEMGL